jgi:hypothetical protein
MIMTFGGKQIKSHRARDIQRKNRSNHTGLGTFRGKQIK